jgi:serine/threonine-protein kinase
MTLPPGTQVGEYIVFRFIGAGGFGEVYEARAKSTQHRVALKLLHDAAKCTDLERFKREALYANRVRDRTKFVPTVVAAGIDARTKRPWLAVDFIDGQTLESMVERRLQFGQRVSWAEAKEILFCVMDALRAAHASHIVHCDIKPANIIVEAFSSPERRWVAYVLDFGIARVRSDFAQRTMTTLAMSPKWAAPEQLDGQAVTPKSDQWSFAQVVYWLLVGERFPMREAQRTTPAQWARARGALLPPLFDAWFARATRNAPDERFESIEHAWRALELVFSNEFASPRTFAHTANTNAKIEHYPMPPQAAMIPAPPTPPMAASTPSPVQATVKSSPRTWLAITAVVGAIAGASIGAVVTLNSKHENGRSTSRAQIAAPIRTISEPGYVAIEQRQDVLDAARRWSAFVQSYGGTPVEHVYLPRIGCDCG